MESGYFALSTATSFVDNAKAILAANQALYAGDNQAQVYQVFVNKGILPPASTPVGISGRCEHQLHLSARCARAFLGGGCVATRIPCSSWRRVRHSTCEASVDQVLLAILAVDSVKLTGSKKSPCTVEWAVTFATYPREALPTAKAPKRPGSTPLWRGEPMTGLVPKIIPSQFLGARVPGRVQRRTAAGQ